MRAYTILLLLLALAWTAPVLAEEAPAAADEPVEIPGPWLYVREMVALAGWPGGLISDTRLQFRAPMFRSKSIVFQDTHAGAGVRFAATPAFVEIGPRFSLAPIDIFDIEMAVGYVFFWPSSSGLIPYDDVDDPKRDQEREVIFESDVEVPAGHAFHAMVAPTIKLKVGPIIVLDAWTFHYYRIVEFGDEVDSNFVYEPYTDRMLDREQDLVIEHQAVVLGEFLDGQHKPLLRIGATFRDTMTIAARDRSMNVGGLMMFKPGYKRGWPTIVLQVLPYIKDHQRLGHVPNIQFALVWSGDHPLTRLSPSGGGW